MLPDSACSCLSGLQRRAGQRPLVCYGWRGGGHPPVLLSSGQPLLSSLPQSSLSLSLAGLDLLSSAESAAKVGAVGALQRRCHQSLLSSNGDTKMSNSKQIVETFSCCSLRIVRVERCRIKTNAIPQKNIYTIIGNIWNSDF